MTPMQSFRDGPRRSLPDVMGEWVYLIVPLVIFWTAVAVMSVKLWHDQYDRATYFLVLVMWMDARLRARIRSAS